MIEAKTAKEAFHRFSIGVNTKDEDIRTLSAYLTQQEEREARENTPTAYMNREQEVIANLNKKLG